MKKIVLMVLLLHFTIGIVITWICGIKTALMLYAGYLTMGVIPAWVYRDIEKDISPKDE